MLKMVVGGQINKQEIHDFIQKRYPDIELAIKNDLDAVNALKMGKFDYYVGACNTGGGGALAMAMALLGSNQCQTISMPGHICSDDEIITAVQAGKTAFGFTAQHAEAVLPVLIDAILKNREDA